MRSLLGMALLFGCATDRAKSGAGETGGAAVDPPPLASVGGRLRDAQGREVLLRGLNARVNGLFDVTFDDGRAALEEIPPFTGADCGFLATELGLNLLRLPVNWSGIEPQPEQYDQAYLDRIGVLVDDCAAVGVLTVVDLHQDAYGKDIGEDGAPLWAIHPPPETLLEGPLTAEELAERRTSAVVLQAFSSLYGDAALASGRTLHTAYAEMAGVLAAALVDHPGAVALELHNEPVALGNQAALDAFHDAATVAVRAAAPALTVAFEPDALRNFSDAAPVRTPFPHDNAIYAPHIYTDVFETGWESEDTDAVAQSIRLAAEEAVDHDSHLFVGEFGHDPRTERGALFIETCLDGFDTHRASWALWLYEEHSQDAWGLWDEGDAAHTRGALREAAADQIARPFPAATAGSLESIAWDGVARTLRVEFSAPVEAPHIVTVPARTWPSGVAATCGGEPVTAAVAGGRAEIDCAVSPLVVGPD